MYHLNCIMYYSEGGGGGGGHLEMYSTLCISTVCLEACYKQIYIIIPDVNVGTPY